MKRSLNIFLFLGTLIKNLKANDPTAAACIVDPSKLVSGLIGNVYYYPWEDDNYGYNDAFSEGGEFLDGVYASNPNIITAYDSHSLTDYATVAENILSTVFEFSSEQYNNDEEVWAENPTLLNKDGSPVTIPVTNYVMSLNGYLIPPVSGVYQFVLENVETGLILSIGNGFAPFGCCETPDQTKGLTNANPLVQVFNTGVNQAQMNLVAGYAYPINILYANNQGGSSYGLSYYEPSSQDLHSDWTGFAWSSYDLSGESICFSEHHTVFNTVPSTTFTTSTSTALITTTATNDDLLIVFTETAISEKLIINEIDPFVLQTSTHFIAYAGSTTATLLTLKSTVSSSILQARVDVEVPLSTSTSTVTSYYTDLENISGYTSVGMVFPNAATPYVSKLVVEAVPYGHTTNTYFLPGPVSTTTTYATDYVTHSSNQEIPPTIETVYHVYIPYSTYSTETTSFYAGDSTYVESSGFLTVTPSGETGTPFVTGTDIVYIPEPVQYVTIYTTGTFNAVTTFEIDETVYNGDVPTIIKTYFVGVPNIEISTSIANSFSNTAFFTSTSTPTPSTSTSSISTSNSASIVIFSGTSNSGFESLTSIPNSLSGVISTFSTVTSSGIVGFSTSSTFVASTISSSSEAISQTQVLLSSSTSLSLSSTINTSSSCIASLVTNAISGNTAVYKFSIDAYSSETFYVIADFPDVPNPPEPVLSFNDYDVCEGTLNQVDYIVEENNSSAIRLWEKIEMSSLDVLQNYTLLATLIAPVNASLDVYSQLVTIVVPVLPVTSVIAVKRDGAVNGFTVYTYSLSSLSSSLLNTTQIDNEQAVSMFGIDSTALNSSISSPYSNNAASLPSNFHSVSSTLALSSSILNSASSNITFVSALFTSSTKAATTRSPAQFPKIASQGFLTSTSLISLSSTKDLATKISSASSTIQNQEATENIEHITIITITSCGTESCYPVVFTTSIVKQSSGILFTNVVTTASISTGDNFAADLSSSSFKPSYYVSSVENKGVGINRLVSATNLLAVLIFYII